MSHVVKTQRSNGSPHWLILGSSSFEGPALRQKYNGWQKKSDTPRSRIGIGTELDSRPISISNACIIEHVRISVLSDIVSIFTVYRNRIDFYAMSKSCRFWFFAYRYRIETISITNACRTRISPTVGYRIEIVRFDFSSHHSPVSRVSLEHEQKVSFQAAQVSNPANQLSHCIQERKTRVVSNKIKQQRTGKKRKKKSRQEVG